MATEHLLSLLTEYSDLLIYPVFAFFCSLGLTAGLIVLLPKLGFVDKGGGRHIHKGRIPRGGGLAIIIALAVTFGFYILDNNTSTIALEFGKKIFYPALILVPLGIIDDRFELRAIYKLVAQIVMVGVIYIIFRPVYTFGGFILPPFFSFCVLLGWVIIIINAFNLIDGMDGLAAGLSVVAALCLAGWFIFDHKTPIAVGMLILAASCLGFLRYNFHPARIFMGDVGSTFLGLFFAVSGLSTREGTATLTSLLVPALAFGLPLFDVLLAVWRRTVRKALDPESAGIMQGDQDHLHHRLLRKLKNQGKVVGVLYSLEILFALGALALLIFEDALPGFSYLIWILVMLVVFRRLTQVELLDSAKLLQHGFARPRKNVLVNMAHPFFDLSVISVVWLFSKYVFLRMSPFYLADFVLAVSPITLTLIGFKIYQIYWLRAGLKSQVRLVGALSIGFFISLICTYYSHKFIFINNLDTSIPDLNFLAYALSFVLLSFSLILLERFLIHYAEGFWVQRLYLENRLNEPIKSPNTLIYGGGLFCRLYVNFNFSAGNRSLDEPIGIIDDDKVLTGMIVNGFQVLGTCSDLETIWQKVKFEQIVITIPEVQAENQVILDEFCRIHQVSLVQWSVTKKPLNNVLPTTPTTN